MRTPSGLIPSLIVIVGVAGSIGCGSEPHDADHRDSLAVEPGLAPRTAPEPEPEPELEPTPEPEPELSERKQALANVGRAAFDALEAGNFEALLQLTPLADPYLGDSCAELPISPRKELEARFEHCRKQIAWDQVAEAQVFAGKPTGAAANGCVEGIEDYGRLQLFLHMNDETIWRVDFYGAVGENGNAIGIDGSISCTETDEAPEL